MYRPSGGDLLESTHPQVPLWCRVSQLATAMWRRTRSAIVGEEVGGGYSHCQLVSGVAGVTSEGALTRKGSNSVNSKYFSNSKLCNVVGYYSLEQNRTEQFCHIIFTECSRFACVWYHTYDCQILHFALKFCSGTSCDTVLVFEQ